MTKVVKKRFGDTLGKKLEVLRVPGPFWARFGHVWPIWFQTETKRVRWGSVSDGLGDLIVFVKQYSWT